MPPVSLVLATDRERYVANLAAYRTDGGMGEDRNAAANGWVEYFANATALACERAAGPGVRVTVCSDNRGRGLRAFELADFRREFPGLDVELRRSGGAFHDRYISLDLGTEGERLFHCGASSKDAGSRVTTIVELRDPGAYRGLLEGLLANSPLELP